MPKLSVWMVRSALIYMGIGFLFGAMLLAHKGIPLFTWTWRLIFLHVEMLIFGWTMQLVMGIAYFILPRFSQRGAKRYGAEHLGWRSYYLLNSGIILTVFAHWYVSAIVILIGRLLVLLAIGLFVAMIWERVKPLADYPKK